MKLVTKFENEIKKVKPIKTNNPYFGYSIYSVYSAYTLKQKQKASKVCNELIKKLIGETVKVVGHKHYTGSIGKIVNIPKCNITNASHLRHYFKHKKIKVSFGNNKIISIDAANLSIVKNNNINLVEKVFHPPKLVDRLGRKIEEKQIIMYSEVDYYTMRTVIGEVYHHEGNLYVKDVQKKSKIQKKYKIKKNAAVAHALILDKDVLSNLMKWKLERIL